LPLEKDEIALNRYSFREFELWNGIAPKTPKIKHSAQRESANEIVRGGQDGDSLDHQDSRG
jgi:hypothetical protein